MRPADREALIERGAAAPAPEPVRALCREAFERFETRALWSTRQLDHSTVAHAVGITSTLKRQGNMAARRLAAKIGRECRAAV